MTEPLIAATDGATLPHNPGPSAWAYVVADQNERIMHEVSGYLGWATNNIAEVTAIREVLKATQGPIVIRSDSQYAINAVSVWVQKWRRNGWKSGKKPVKNRELIEETANLVDARDVEFVWVRAHQAGGDALNAAADRLANATALEGGAVPDVAEDEPVPCPDCGREVQGDAGLYACPCGRIFEVEPDPAS